MEKKIYYPAVFFADIVKYYGGSETYIEEQMNNNIALTKTNILHELKCLIEELKVIDVKKEQSDIDSMGARILDDLNKIKNGGKEQKKISKIKQIIGKVKVMQEIDKEISYKILLRIQELSEKVGSTGYSDTNILRLMDKEQNALKEEKYHDIVNFLIEPSDYSELCKWLLRCISAPKYVGIPDDEHKQIEQNLKRTDFSGVHIIRIFRILQKCSVGFSEEERKDELDGLKFANDWEIFGNIRKILENIWGEIEEEGIGISHEEKEKISVDVAENLIKDYKFYNYSIGYDIESSKGFQALIFYRLCNKIFYYKRNNEEESDDIQKSLVFFSFIILQRAIEHTEILIHPAAYLGVPIFIGDKVMIGKQCKIEAECVLGNNVCLYPFSIYNRDIQRRDAYIYIEENTILCNDVKVLGSIHIGRGCVINKSILVGDNIENRKYVNNDKVEDISDEEHYNNKVKVMGGKL